MNTNFLNIHECYIRRSPRLQYQLTHPLGILLQVMNDEETFLAGDVEKDESNLANIRVANQVNKSVF